MPDFTPAPHNSFDTHRRLARYLTHAAKTGVSPSECRDVLLALRVQAGHPHAAPFTLRVPHRRNIETVYIDTSCLPCDHGGIRRLHGPAVADAVRYLARIAETAEPGIAEAARRAIELATGSPL